MDCGNARSHIPEMPKPMMSAIAPAKMMIMLIMLWRDRETGNYFIPSDRVIPTQVIYVIGKRCYIKHLNFLCNTSHFLETGTWTGINSSSPRLLGLQGRLEEWPLFDCVCRLAFLLPDQAGPYQRLLGQN